MACGKGQDRQDQLQYNYMYNYKLIDYTKMTFSLYQLCCRGCDGDSRNTMFTRGWKQGDKHSKWWTTRLESRAVVYKLLEYSLNLMLV